jgi:hypothetical protein
MKSFQVFSMRSLCATILLGWAGLLTAQISGPVTGYVFHSATKTIRPIVGVPGGALVANPVVRNVDFGSVSPDGRLALVRRYESVAVVKLGGEEPEEVALSGVIPGIDMASWSGSGRVVVVASSSKKMLQSVHPASGNCAADLSRDFSGRTPGRPTQPSCPSGGQWLADLPRDLSDLPGSLAALSANYGADHVVVGLTDPARGGLYLVSDAGPVLVKAAPLPVVAVFAAAGGNTFYAAGCAAGVIDVFESADHVASLSFKSDNGAPAEVTALAPSSDGKRLFAVLKDLPRLWSFDLTSKQQLPVQQLETKPTTLLPVAGHSWLLLSSPKKTNEPLSIVKDSDPAATYFVPVAEINPTSL